jgi:hypothetical protein
MININFLGLKARKIIAQGSASAKASATRGTPCVM